MPKSKMDKTVEKAKEKYGIIKCFFKGLMIKAAPMQDKIGFKIQ